MFSWGPLTWFSMYQWIMYHMKSAFSLGVSIFNWKSKKKTKVATNCVCFVESCITIPLFSVELQVHQVPDLPSKKKELSINKWERKYFEKLYPSGNNTITASYFTIYDLLSNNSENHGLAPENKRVVFEFDIFYTR